MSFHDVTMYPFMLFAHLPILQTVAYLFIRGWFIMHRDGPRNNRHVLTLLHDDITVGPVHLYTRSQMTSTNFKFFSGLGFPTDIVYLTQQATTS